MDKRIIKITLLSAFCIFMLIAVYLVYSVFYPEIYYQTHLKDNIKPPQNITGDSMIAPTPSQENFPDRLIIPKISVNMELGTDPKTLNIAGWVQNQYPDNSPMVIAVHRFGWVGMPLDRKVTNTLYNIDKLNVGDEVVIQWNGKKLTFKVKDIIESNNNPAIKDGEVLIYTCKFLRSEKRMFVILI